MPYRSIRVKIVFSYRRQSFFDCFYGFKTNHFQKFCYFCPEVFLFCFFPLVALLNRFSSLLRASIGFLARRNGIYVYLSFFNCFKFFDAIIGSIGIERF